MIGPKKIKVPTNEPTFKTSKWREVLRQHEQNKAEHDDDIPDVDNRPKYSFTFTLQLASYPMKIDDHPYQHGMQSTLRAFDSPRLSLSASWIHAGGDCRHLVRGSRTDSDLVEYCRTDIGPKRNGWYILAKQSQLIPTVNFSKRSAMRGEHFPLFCAFL